MSDLISQTIKRHAHAFEPVGRCTLTYHGRFLRRRMLSTDAGLAFLVDLEHTESLNHGDAFILSDGTLIEVLAAQEPLIEIRGDDLVRIAWHIGNRHTPCQIESSRLLIQPGSKLSRYWIMDLMVLSSSGPVVATRRNRGD